MENEKAEFWLLDSVINSTVTLDLLVSKSLGEILNRREHGLSYPVLISTLHKLFEREELFAEPMSNFLSPERAIRDPQTNRRIDRRVVGEPFKPTLTQIEAGVRGDTPIEYGLTQKGGARWEHLTNADWKRYLIDCYYWSDDMPVSTVTIISQDENLVKQYLAFAKRQTAIFIDRSEKWKTLSPWQATYWKVLPVGHWLQLDYKDPPGLETVKSPEFARWFGEIKKWYTSPYK